MHMPMPFPSRHEMTDSTLPEKEFLLHYDSKENACRTEYKQDYDPNILAQRSPSCHPICQTSHARRELVFFLLQPDSVA